MARKVGQIIAHGDRRWLIRVYLGSDHETKKRKYHNRPIYGSMWEAQAYLTGKLRERDLGRDLEGAKITVVIRKNLMQSANASGSVQGPGFSQVVFRF